MNSLALKPNHAPFKARLLPIALLTLLILPVAKISAQSTGQLYALGVQMGFASFQASIAAGATDENGRLVVWDRLRKALIEAQNLGRNMNPPFLTQVTQQDLYFWGYNDIVSARDGYTAQLAKTGRSEFVHAYVLGVNIGIAEGQATAGDPARQIVYSSLINAKPEAQALGLDLNPLNECIYLANTTTPMREVYAKIVSLRSIYQSSLR